VTIADSDLAEVGERIVEIGSGNPDVCFEDNHIEGWGSYVETTAGPDGKPLRTTKHVPSSAIVVASGIFLCTGNYFGGNTTDPQVEIGRATKKALVTVNMSAPGATFTVQNAIGAQAQVSNNF